MDKSIMLNPSDYVGMSFWIISAAMVAATFFFWVERDRAVGKWKTSLTVAAMVTGIAAIHYFYMREVWIYTGDMSMSSESLMARTQSRARIRTLSKNR